MKKLHLNLRILVKKLYKGRKKGWQDAAQNLTIGIIAINAVSLIFYLDFIFDFGLMRRYETNNPIPLFLYVTIIGVLLFLLNKFVLKTRVKRFNIKEIKTIITKQSKTGFIHALILLVITLIFFISVLFRISTEINS